MQKYWQSIRSFSRAAPLWIKLMGIGVIPVLIVLAAASRGSLLATALAALAGVGLAYGCSLVLARPLQQLLAANRRVEAGDLSGRVRIWAPDEIGQVQAAFNEMTASLEKAHETLLDQNRELAAVNALAEALHLDQGVEAGEQSLASQVQMALQRILALMAADAGALYLLEKSDAGDQSVLRLRAAAGPLPPELIRAMTGAGQEKGFLRLLLKTGRAAAVEDIAAAPEFSADLAGLLSRQGFTSWASAPLKIEGEATGIYHLGFRRKRLFSIHDLALLEIIGNLVGSSLSNARLLKDLRRKEAELRRALHRSVEVQEEERRRLARELHDEIGQALTSILIQLKTLQEEQDCETVRARLNDMRAYTGQTIEELRRIAVDLRPAILDSGDRSLGIAAALRWYTQQCSERTGLNIHYRESPEDFERLSPEIELTLYRVAQEGITNAIRHGKAERIEVKLEQGQKTVRLVVHDNGRGFNAVVLDQGLGLVGIRERVELMDGSFSVQSTPGAGTDLCIEIPLKR